MHYLRGTHSPIYRGMGCCSYSSRRVDDKHKGMETASTRYHPHIRRLEEMKNGANGSQYVSAISWMYWQDATGNSSLIVVRRETNVVDVNTIGAFYTDM